MSRRFSIFSVVSLPDSVLTKALNFIPLKPHHFPYHTLCHLNRTDKDEHIEHLDKALSLALARFSRKRGKRHGAIACLDMSYHISANFSFHVSRAFPSSGLPSCLAFDHLLPKFLIYIKSSKWCRLAI